MSVNLSNGFISWKNPSTLLCFLLTVKLVQMTSRISGCRNFWLKRDLSTSEVCKFLWCKRVECHFPCREGCSVVARKIYSSFSKHAKVLVSFQLNSYLLTEPPWCWWNGALASLCRRLQCIPEMPGCRGGGGAIMARLNSNCWTRTGCSVVGVLVQHICSQATQSTELRPKASLVRGDTVSAKRVGDVGCDQVPSPTGVAVWPEKRFCPGPWPHGGLQLQPNVN